MANNYRGYLLKFGGTILPNYFLKFNECNSTPNQRVELEAYRDDYTQELHRTTSEGLKSKLEYNVPVMDLDKKIEFQNILANGLVDRLQRKYNVEYWNDETNDYENGYFYIPDVQYSIYSLSTGTIKYNPFKLTLIEY